MKNMSWICIILIPLCNIVNGEPAHQNEIVQTNELKRIAYYPRWSHESDLTPDKVNATLFTHLIFGFATVQDGSMVVGDPQDPQRFQDLLKLKEQSPSLKIMISVATGAGDLTLSNISSDSGQRAKFVNSTVLFLKKYGFDGFDIDWEFPAFGGGPLSDKENFVLLLKDIRDAFDKEPTPFLLSIAAPAAWTIIIPGYDVPKINRYVDFVNLMTYDFHLYKWFDPVTGHNSPLFKRPDEALIWATLNTAWASNFWVQLGMTKTKLLIGLPLYGIGFILTWPEKHGFSAPAMADNGTYSYFVMCQFLASGATRVFDNDSQVPYAYKDKQWIGYDDEDSVTSKCNWVKEQEFGGVFTWALTHDDWKKICGPKMFPLHTVIYNILS